MALSLDPTKAPLSAVGALGKSLSHHVDGDAEIIGLCLELGSAVGANVSVCHQNKVSANGDQKNRDGNIIPRHVKRIPEPVYLAGGEHKRRAEQNGTQYCFFHSFTVLSFSLYILRAVFAAQPMRKHEEGGNSRKTQAEMIAYEGDHHRRSEEQAYTLKEEGS